MAVSRIRSCAEVRDAEPSSREVSARPQRSASVSTATEMAKYTQRLNALDWRIDEMLFNLEFEVPYTSFWAWRGVVEDR